MNDRKLVLKIATITWNNASRDERELAVIRELNADILVMAKGEKTGVIDNVGGYKVYRMSTRPFGDKAPKCVNRVWSFVEWVKQIQRFHADILTCHGLLALFLGWLSTLFMGKSKPLLVYDSHEFTIYDGHTSKAKSLLITLAERFLIKRSVFTIEVGDIIADEVQRIHKMSKRPVVVRNIPNLWKLDFDEIQRTREELCSCLNVDENTFWISVHGGITPNRGIEVIIRALPYMPGVCLLVLGNGAEDYLAHLKKIAQDLCVDDRIVFHAAVPLSELYKYLAAVNVGYVGIENGCKSLYYCLPNKFFENIQAQTPIVCSNFPEMKKICDQYEIGMTVNPDDIQEISKAILQMKNDDVLYKKFKTNCMAAKEELCWEKERVTLLRAYKEII